MPACPFAKVKVTTVKALSFLGSHHYFLEGPQVYHALLIRFIFESEYGALMWTLIIMTVINQTTRR